MSILAINSPYRSGSDDNYALPGGTPTSLLFALSEIENAARIPIFNYPIWSDATKKILIETLEEHKPSIVLCSTTSPGRAYTLQIAEIIKWYNPAIQIVVGGPDCDESLMRQGNNVIINQYGILGDANDKKHYLDYIVAIQWMSGAKILPHLLQTLTDGYRGVQVIEQLRETLLNWQSIVWYRSQNTLQTAIIGNKPTNYSYENNFYRFSKPSTYFRTFDRQGTAYLTINARSTLGCQQNCSFCAEWTSVQGKIVKQVRNINIPHNRPERYQQIWDTIPNKTSASPMVLNALDQVLLGCHHGAQAIWFEDSTIFLWQWDVMQQWCETLIRLKTFVWGTTIPLDTKQSIQQCKRWCQMTFNQPIDRVLKYPNIFGAIKQSGCPYIFFGGEWLTQDTMSRIQKSSVKQHKGDRYDRATQALQEIKKHDFIVYMSLLFGLLWESKDSIDVTIQRAAVWKEQWLVDGYSPNIMTYHPGTDDTKRDHPPINYNTIQAITWPYIAFEHADGDNTSIHLNCINNDKAQTIEYIIEQLIKQIWPDLYGAHTPSRLHRYL